MISIDEESDRAQCGQCNISDMRDHGIECEGCGDWICLSCWKGDHHGKSPHFCGLLTEQNGYLIHLGDQLYYPSRETTVYQVVEITPSFVKNMLCYGTIMGKREQAKVLIRPRLMRML